jgi:hypothetical protein
MDCFSNPPARNGNARIVCLANSRKRCGRCIAGKIMASHQQPRWVRPVSDRPDQELSERERLYADATEPQLLDLMEIPLKAHRPSAHQSENWVLDSQVRWVRKGHVGWSELFPLTDYPRTLWKNRDSSFHGLNDRVKLAHVYPLSCSLYFLHLPRFRLRVFTLGENPVKRERRVQGAFRFQGVNYRFWVTDPAIEAEYLARPDAEYGIGECYVTVSLSEPFLGHCYKLIAAVITAESERQDRAERKSTVSIDALRSANPEWRRQR